jgi:SAM-dependent methyltransferase
METIRGRMSHILDLNGLKARLTNDQRVLLDLGTGDGRYVHALADRNPDWFIIGVDTCRENLEDHSRAKAPNMLFLIASAQDLPHELNGLVSHITINFPWGSLLQSLLAGDASLLNGLSCIARHEASIEILLNGGAMTENGVDLECGAIRIQQNLWDAGWRIAGPYPIAISALQKYPSTWARRLAHGRDPRVMALRGRRMA